MKRLLHSLLALSLIRPALLAVILCFAIGDSANAAPISGTKTVGPTGDYASLTAAIADVQAVGNGLGGALVLELQAAYVSTVETFPLTIPALNGASAVNTLTIRLASGATALSISSAETTAATVDLNGAQFVTIDGRPGGTGSSAGSGGGGASQLTIANTDPAGVALRFINEAGTNTIRYTTLRGVETSSSSGTVVFSTTTGANGNDNNTIDHCDIRDGASTPANGIYSLGTTTTMAQGNSGNIVSNCNIFNFYSATNGVDVAGVRLDGGNTDWTVMGNSFYQNASRASVDGSVAPILINNTSGNNFTVTGNFIGGSAPGAGGTASTTTNPNSQEYLFVGIQLNVGSTTASSVQGNTVQNIVWASSTPSFFSPVVWRGIYVQGGWVNIGTVIGNTIGSGTGTGSILVTELDDTTISGISSGSSGTVAIANNTIGSITATSSGGTAAVSLVGIDVTAGTNTISNNTIGSITTANSLNAVNSANTTHNQQVVGIRVGALSTSANITGNMVANLNNNSTQASAGLGQIRGIYTSVGVNTIIGNTIRNLSTTSRNAGTATSQSVYGIVQFSATAGQTISQNTVHSLANTAATANVNVTGIYYAGLSSGTNVIARNLVHSLAVSSSGTSSQLNGIQFAGGTFTAQNNMVRVGLKADGTSTAGAATVRGIYDNGTTATRKFYHNSIYVGGTQTSGGSNSFAFSGSTGVSNARIYQDNIFVNARGTGGGTGKHYAVQYGGTGVNPAGLTAGGNIFLASGTGGVLGSYNFVDITTLTAWQAATGQDSTSLNTDPLFVNPTGDAATVDLHIPTNSPATIAGLAIGVTDDFDGEARSLFAPAIGADESPVPNIAVEQPVGNGLTDGVSAKDFGTATVNDGTVVAIFKITNTGTADLTGLAVTLVPGTANAGEFGTTQPVSTTLAPGVSTFFNVSFTPSELGVRTAAIHIASNVTGAKNPFDIALTGTGITILENWRQTFYGTTGNTGTAADNADPYHTGVPNLAVFAVLGPNQDPAKVAASLLPQPQMSDGKYGITFDQPSGVSGVIYGAEWSTDLSPLGWTTIPDTGTGATHVFSVTSSGHLQIFMRLRVSTPP